MKRLLFLVISLATASVYAQKQTPVSLSVSSVVAGAQKTETLFVHAVGKWSDADDHMALYSTEIHCYERFGFCEEADATFYDGEAGATLNSFDILRWDKQELIAVDSSPICVVNTLRVDFAAKKVTITNALKGETKDPYCKNIKATTAFLGGVEAELKKQSK